VAQVRTAVSAEDRGAWHEEAVGRGKLDILGVDRLVEARPASTGFELGVRAEQLGAAGGAGVGAVSLGVDVLAGERPLGPLPSQDVVLLGRQLGAPLSIGFPN